MAGGIRILYTLPGSLYVTGAPVLIAGGTLSLEQQTGRIFVQLGLRNIDVKPVSAVTLAVTPLDPANRPIREVLSFSFLDLDVPRDGIFGQATPLTMPDFNTRAFTVRVTEVIFTDHSFWTAPDEPWEPFPKQALLAETYGDEELCRQFRLRFGEDSIFSPDQPADLWRCTCGGVNRAGEERCHRCSRQLGLLLGASRNDLVAEKNARLAAEQAERDRLEAERRAAAEARIAAEAERKAAKERQKAARAQQKAAKAEAEAIRTEPEPVKEAPHEEPEQSAETKPRKGREKKNLLITLAVIVGAVVAGLILHVLTTEKPEKPEKLYAQAEQLEQDGKIAEAAITFGKAGDYEDAHEHSLALWDGVAERKMIAAGEDFAIAVQANGQVVSFGADHEGASDFTGCTDVIAVDASHHHAVVLMADGTAAAAGYSEEGQCDVSEWSDIVAVAAGGYHSVGLRMDGTVVAVGRDSSWAGTQNWTDIVAVDAGENHTVGLRADGTVVAAGSNDCGECEVSEWTDIVAIAANRFRTVGLRADGTVVAAGNKHLDAYDLENYGEDQVSGWTDIVAVSAGGVHTVGLRADGTVVAVGDNRCGQCDVSGWTDVVTVYACEWATFAIRADGTILFTGFNNPYWTDIKLPNR